MSDYSGDYLTARNKINQGTDWRGTASVAVDGNELAIGHRLLNEEEFFDIKRVIPLSELREYRDEDESDAEKRLRELQSRDEELTKEETEELEQLQGEIAAKQDDIEDALGKEAYDKLMWAGKQAIMPTEDDIEDIIQASPEVQREVLCQDGEDLPNPMLPGSVEPRLKRDMVETVEAQPYPIKYTIGMKAFVETVSVLGNGLNREG